MGERHTVIVGGGVIGICAAYFLAKRGARVTVLEKQKIGEAASFGNAGSIAPGHPPINKPGRMWQAIKWMFDPTSPLFLSKPWDPRLIKWLLSFQAKCTDRHLQTCMDVLAPMGHETQDLFDRVVKEESLDCDYRRRGYYEVFLTEKGLAGGRADAELLRTRGYDVPELSGGEMREREPAFVDELAGAIFHEEAATCQPHRFVVEMARACRQHGAAVRDEIGVDEILVQGSKFVGVRAGNEKIEADSVVLATGVYSQHLTRALGYRMPLQAAKGYHRDSAPTEGGAPPLREACILGEAFVFCTPMDDYVRFAGTLEFSGVDDTIRAPRLDALTRSARKYFSEVGDGGTRSVWSGMRPCLPDGMPVIGSVPGYEGIFIANGHAMMGLTLGPVTGKIVEECVLDGGSSRDLRLMDPARY